MSIHPPTEKVIIINSGKCAWGGCTYCGWGRLVARQKDMHRLKEFWDDQVRDIKPGTVKRIKIFCSGCFLDPKQIVPAFRSYVVRSCEKLGVKSLIVESFPRFITPENLENMRSDKVKILAGIGLECADDEVLKKIRKGFTLADFEKAHDTLKKYGWGIRAYLLVNAPGMTEKHVKKSVEYASKWAEETILINTLPHYAAPIMLDWLEGRWKPLDRKQFDDIVEPIVKTYPNVENDFQNFNFVPKWPLNLQQKIRGATEKELLHPHFEVWQDYMCRFWQPKNNILEPIDNIAEPIDNIAEPIAKDILVFLPCAFRKPYFNSQLHQAIMPVLQESKEWDRMQVVVISSPGVIPYEYANYYPFNSYDWPEWEETNGIKKKYVEVTQQRVENFLRSHQFKKIVCYFKPTSESFNALNQACENLGLELQNLIDEETFSKVENEKNPLAQAVALREIRSNLL